MLKLIVLLAAGVFVYTMGLHAASASTDEAGAEPQAAWELAATTGGTWIARELHEQTAWAVQAAPDQPPAAFDLQPVINISVR